MADFCASAFGNQVIFVFNSSKDSLIYFTTLIVSIFYAALQNILRILLNNTAILYFNTEHILSISQCTGGGTRTLDTWFWRPVLYQLSYARKNEVTTKKVNHLVIMIVCILLQDFSYLTCTYSSTSLTDCKT